MLSDFMAFVYSIDICTANIYLRHNRTVPLCHLKSLGTPEGRMKNTVENIKNEMAAASDGETYDLEKSRDIMMTVSRGVQMAKSLQNGDPFNQMRQLGNLPSKGDVPNREYAKAFENITDDEKNIYYYMLAKYGEEQAEEYFSYLAQTKYREAMADYQKSVKDTSVPVLRYFERLLMRPAATVEGLGAAAANLGDVAKSFTDRGNEWEMRKGTISDISGDERVKRFTPKKRYYINEFQNLLTEAMTENKSGVGKALTNLAITVGDMGEDFAIGAAMGGTFGNAAGITAKATRAAMGTSVFSNSYIDAIGRDIEPDKAFFGSLLMGVIACVLEENPVSNILESKYSSNFLKQIFKTALSEGGEEFAEEELDNLLDKYYYADKSQWQEIYNQFKDAGYDESEARKQANLQAFVWQPLEAFFFWIASWSKEAAIMT